MQERLDYADIAPDLTEAIVQVEPDLEETSLSPPLVEFVKLRASQINGCAYCVDLHTQRFEDMDVGSRKIAAVAVWHESPFFIQRERTALNLTEELTRLPSGDIPAPHYERAVDEFGTDGVVALVRAVLAINCWNRLWVTFRSPGIDPITDKRE